MSGDPLLLHERNVDLLSVQVYENRQDMGIAAGMAAADKIKALLKAKKQIRIIFAAAPSQNEFLQTLAGAENIDWSRITAFHMDEQQVPGCFFYLGSGPDLNAEKTYGLHHPRFNLDERCIPLGSALLAAIAAERLL